MTLMRSIAKWCLLVLSLAACGGPTDTSPKTSVTNDKSSVTAAANFAAGADVSWVTQLEQSGYTWKNSNKVAADPFVLLRDIGMNAIRLRVWVNPTDGWCNVDDVLVKAKRAAAQGMRIMLDFHYSDSWADPGQQTKPAAWAGHSVSQLNDDIASHTQSVLNTLKSAGITVEWVEVGNEINSGMLWPEGKNSTAAGFANLAGFINSGYSAVKAVYPSALVVVHLSNGYDDNLYRWFFDNIKANGARWDVIGLSHYPPAFDWPSFNSKIDTTMRDMISRYGKPVMVTEVGMDWTQETPSQQMSDDLIKRVKALGASGLGVLYWEPEAFPGWNQYSMGATTPSGNFTSALSPYKTSPAAQGALLMSPF